VSDPALNAIHAGLLRAYGGDTPADPERLRAAESKAAEAGPEALSLDERLVVLQDADAIERLHMTVWTRWASTQRAAQ
jgi:membrane glycosyltransferase